jgi:hypothetical protein
VLKQDEHDERSRGRPSHLHSRLVPVKEEACVEVDLSHPLRRHSRTLAQSESGLAGIRDTPAMINIRGSYGVEGMRLATTLHVQAWVAAQKARGVDVNVEILD